MNKINDLTVRLCTKGVEFRHLWELTSWNKKFRGVEQWKQESIADYPSSVSAKQLRSMEDVNGDVLLLSAGNYVGHTNEGIAGDNLRTGEIIAIPEGGRANIKYHKGKFINSYNLIATSLDINVLSNRYLYYCMADRGDLIQSFYRGSGVQHPDMREILEIKIPVPALPIQHEIVRVLDSFTDLESELEVELRAELWARRSQYEYYRNQLLTFGDASGGGSGS